MFTKTSKRYKTEALKTDAEYQSPQYVDILDVTYVTMGRII